MTAEASMVRLVPPSPRGPSSQQIPPGDREDLLVVPAALISGSLQHAADTALVLKAAGFEVVVSEPDASQLPTTLRQIDCYVQLPLDPPWAQDDALTWARSVVSNALLARFDAAARVAPLLVPNSSSKAIITDHGGPDVRVTVINGLRSPEQIMAAAQPRPAAWTAYRSIEPDLAYSDWRNEVICQSSLTRGLDERRAGLIEDRSAIHSHRLNRMPSAGSLMTARQGRR